MPSDDDIQNLHVIIFEDAAEAEQIQRFIRKHALVASREVGDRAHYHCAIHLPQVIKRKAFIKMMKDEINASMKGTTHFKTVTWDTYGENTSLEQYICKGPLYPDNGPGDYDNHPPEMIVNNTLISSRKYHDDFWAQAKEKPKVAKEKAKQAKKLGTKCIDEISLKYKGCDIVPTHQNVIEDTMDFYEGRCQDHQLFPVIQAIMYRIDPKQTKDLAVNRIYRKFFD